MKIKSKRKASQIVSQEPKFKKQKSDSKDEQLKELREKTEQIQAAADRNSVKMGKIMRQNQNYLQQLAQMKTNLDKERQEADKWRQKFIKLNQDFEKYRRNKREDTIADRIKSRNDKKLKNKLATEFKNRLAQQKQEFEFRDSMINVNLEHKANEGITSIWCYLHRKKNLIDTILKQLQESNVKNDQYVFKHPSLRDRLLS